tara:strand:- start:3481 stop:4164 length:684 start_codon:yes stop_codon:yes gene_type:complete
MAERQPVVKRSCAFCQDPDRDSLEQALLDGTMTVKQMDKEMGWRANTADRHFRNHMGDYHMAANPSCVLCTHPQRAEFESNYFDGTMTSDEIASAAECPESTVYHHIKNHFQPLVQRAAVTEVSISVGNEMNVLRSNVETLNTKLGELMEEKDIHDDGFVRDAVTLHKEVRESIKDLSKLTNDWGSTGEGSQVNQTINIMKVELAKESPETWKRIREELIEQIGEDI